MEKDRGEAVKVILDSTEEMHLYEEIMIKHIQSEFSLIHTSLEKLKVEFRTGMRKLQVEMMREMASVCQEFQSISREMQAALEQSGVRLQDFETHTHSLLMQSFSERQKEGNFSPESSRNSEAGETTQAATVRQEIPQKMTVDTPPYTAPVKVSTSTIAAKAPEVDEDMLIPGDDDLVLIETEEKELPSSLDDLDPEFAQALKPFVPAFLTSKELLTSLQYTFFMYMFDLMQMKDSKDLYGKAKNILQEGVKRGTWHGNGWKPPGCKVTILEFLTEKNKSVLRQKRRSQIMQEIEAATKKSTV